VLSIQSRVVVTDSVGGLLREAQCAPAYVGSKAAFVSLVKHASTGLAEYEIRVNVLAPGFACCPAPRLSIALLIVWQSFPSEMANASSSRKKVNTTGPTFPLGLPVCLLYPSVVCKPVQFFPCMGWTHD
jgi:NAD(P)-dependent dehydrogenase (short-subunit alcohol dehydrogenase family)